MSHSLRDPAVTAPALDAMEHEPLGDARVRQLIERYVELAGAGLKQLAPHLFEMEIPAADRAAFAARRTVRVAFSVEAAQEDGEAEMAIIGSTFIDQLIAAIRNRGARLHAGALAGGEGETAVRPAAPVPARHASYGPSSTRRALTPLGRVTCRVVIRAGTGLEEHLAESRIFDLSTGLPVGADVESACHAMLHGGSRTANAEPPSLERMALRDTKQLVQMMLADLEARLTPDIQRLREKAEHELAHETNRIDRYYTSILADMGGRGSEIPDADARRAVEAERCRRLDDEKGRHEVRATVHPVQLTEWDACVERVEWPLVSDHGHSGTFSAQRILAGERVWVYGCANCGAREPAEITVCERGHTGCADCSDTCSVCAVDFCRFHGTAMCHVDQRPACSTHALTCASCLRTHCSEHASECAEGGHPACSACLRACEHCARVICDAHAERTHDKAPRGPRRLCTECVRLCEGGTGEIVGLDEVSGCATCERVVCERHQARCSVDGMVHCSDHLRRTDRSRRLVCEKDRAACTFETHAILAIDEVHPCTTCGRLGCDVHLGVCIEDEKQHCIEHLAPLNDRPGFAACEAHRTACHVDGAFYSFVGITECPVCGRQACRKHLASCSSCGRAFCITDASPANASICLTCSRMAPVDVPEENLVAAFARLLPDARPRGWRASRDTNHAVVEVELGWTRRAVFAVRHGDDAAERAFVHSMLGSRKLVG